MIPIKVNLKDKKTKENNYFQYYFMDEIDINLMDNIIKMIFKSIKCEGLPLIENFHNFNKLYDIEFSVFGSDMCSKKRYIYDFYGRYRNKQI